MERHTYVRADFSAVQKLLIMGFVLSVAGALWYLIRIHADTTIGLTLNTNPSLENGLVGHWTFDGDALQMTSTSSTHGFSESFTDEAFPPTATCDSWTTGGDVNWVRGTHANDYDTSPAAASSTGALTNSQSNYLDCDYTAPSNFTLSFRWKVSSESGSDYLLFCMDNDACTRTSGYETRITGTGGTWATVTRSGTAGTHSFRWMYAKDSSGTSGLDGDRKSVV